MMMMSSSSSSRVEASSSSTSSSATVNAAATAIVSAESRVQPTSVQKRRWPSCWSIYWCFGSQKNNKRISHAVFVPEPVLPGGPVTPAMENHQTQSSTVVIPFIAPPSSPASFLQSDPPSATQTPGGPLSLTAFSVNSFSPGGPTSVFAIGPYAYENQLVSPPTAPFTPPPESVQATTPSSPEVPFSQLLNSSLERARRNSGGNQKFTLYQFYQGSPGSQLISPGSVISTSGTSTPFPDRRSILELRMSEGTKLLAFDHYTTYKWGSRLGSGSLTPDGIGLGSWLGSGCLTPYSRLGSGCMTPQDCFLIDTQISEVASLSNSENGRKGSELVVNHNHRVSFELSGEDVARCLELKSSASPRFAVGCPEDSIAEGPTGYDNAEKVSGEQADESGSPNPQLVKLGSTKEFNFDSTKGEVSHKPSWWSNHKSSGKESNSSNSWSFFPMLQHEVS
ncbi:hypothetical protein ACFE04_015206 [Oxalis oulophora]